MLSCTVTYVNDMGHYIPKMGFSGDQRNVSEALSKGVMQAAWELTESNVYRFVENGAMGYAAVVPSKQAVITVNGTDVELTVVWDGPLKDPNLKAELLRDIQARINNLDWAEHYRRTEGDWLRATSSEEPLMFH
jgi:hypothetical protein